MFRCAGPASMEMIRAVSVPGGTRPQLFSTRLAVHRKRLSGFVLRWHPGRVSIVLVELQVHEELSNSILLVSGLLVWPLVRRHRRVPAGPLALSRV